MIGMFPLDPVLESRYGVHKIRGFVAIHFISARATRYRARHTLWLESMPTLLDFLLKLLFSEHVSSVSLCHLSSLPHYRPGTKCSLRPLQGRPIHLQYLCNQADPFTVAESLVNAEAASRAMSRL